MTNSTPWQTMMKNTTTPTFPLTTNNSATSEKAAAKQNAKVQSLSTKHIAVVMRHSFDDNGGSYKGL